MISILENYLNIAHAQQHLKMEQKAIMTLTQGLTLGYMILRQCEDKRCLYLQRLSYQKPSQEVEYIISLITSCHKQKYAILVKKNKQVAVSELRQALKTAKAHISMY
jgi:hypothetical protein